MSSKKLSSQISLLEATKNAPREMGCYQLFLEGEVKYVGKAEEGLRKRLSQRYNGNAADYSSAKKIYVEREKITVSWQLCDSGEECKELKREWIRELKPEWNVIGGGV
ncbi:MAG: GIY-YIG nuclease family protein [Roseburia sp.]|nr:GIY-YIG nuclease family protein [Roseburia sp.]